MRRRLGDPRRALLLPVDHLKRSAKRVRGVSDMVSDMGKRFGTSRDAYLRGLVTYLSDHVLTFHPLTVCTGPGSDAPSPSTNTIAHHSREESA